MILSGDHMGAVEVVRESLGMVVEDVRASLTPEEKLAIVEQLCDDGLNVVMVGDGVNDAAALQRAHVGVAVAGGSHLALAAADVFMTRGGLDSVELLLEGSRDVMTLVRRNILYALGYNVIGVTVAAMGLVTPLVAAIAMPTSSVLLLLMTWLHPTFTEVDASAASQRDITPDIDAEAKLGHGEEVLL